MRRKNTSIKPAKKSSRRPTASREARTRRGAASATDADTGGPTGKPAAHKQPQPQPRPQPHSQPQPITKTARPRPVTISYQRSTADLLDSLGGPSRVIDALHHSRHPQAATLADRLLDPKLQSLQFSEHLKEANISSETFLLIFESVKRSQLLSLAWHAGPEIIHGVLEQAKQQTVRCSSCRNTGFQLDDESGEPTDIQCYPCEGTGWLTKPGDQQAIELWSDIVKLRKTGMDINVDARKQVFNPQQQVNVFGVSSPGAAPDISMIVKRLDEQIILPKSLQKQLPDGSATSDPLYDQLEPTTGGDQQQQVVEAEIVTR